MEAWEKIQTDGHIPQGSGCDGKRNQKLLSFERSVVEEISVR
jgi:hypothetical protein